MAKPANLVPSPPQQLGECIGKGQFGSVYRALNIHTGSVVAVKRIQLAGKSEEEIIQLQKEVDLLKRLSHPSVVTYEGLVRTDNYVNIILELVTDSSAFCSDGKADPQSRSLQIR